MSGRIQRFSRGFEPKSIGAIKGAGGIEKTGSLNQSIKPGKIEVEYTVVGGGGSGGAHNAGGGGGGNVRQSYGPRTGSTEGAGGPEGSIQLSLGVNHAVSIGAGATALPAIYPEPNPFVGPQPGTLSYFRTSEGHDITANGAYGSASGNGVTPGTYYSSGGGSGQIYAGGGGAAGNGQSSPKFGTGGPGVLSYIDNYYYGGGGGGSAYSGNAGDGGRGGGGAGSPRDGGSSGTADTNGRNSASGREGGVNTGGGGGAANTAPDTGGNGGSGCIVLRYPAEYTLTAGPGVTASTSNSGAYKVTAITSGSGNISWS